MFKGGRLLAFVVLAFAACNSDSGPGHGGPGKDMTSGVGGNGDDMAVEPMGPDMTGEVQDMSLGLPLTIAPLDPVLKMAAGAAAPTQQFTASVAGVQISPSWSIDRGELGSLDVSTGLFTASGTQGGKATVTASYKGQTASTSVTVDVTW
jgi:hypothetical protein